MSQRRSRAVLQHAVAALGAASAALLACSDAGDGGSVGGDARNNLGVAGASCLRSADCESPLQCLDNVCRALGGSDAADAAGGGGADAPPLADAPADGALSDSETTFEDLPVPDIVTDYDVSDWEFVEDSAPDTTPEAHVSDDAIFEGCGVLGISESWSGPFAGLIEFHVSDNPLTPSDGLLPVEGTLTFDIECIETKFVVKGSMDGTATIEGQGGTFPFTLQMQGYYSPLNRQMQAQMVDGKVNIYGLVEVYFEGEFLGELMEDGEFDGTWEGHSTGTNQTFITGTAEGSGTWGAAPL
jgi:hypothetical protein